MIPLLIECNRPRLLAAIAALIGVVALSLPTIVFALPFVGIAVIGIAAALTERAQRPRQVRAVSAPVAPVAAPAMHAAVAPRVTMPRMAMPRAVAPAVPVVRMSRPAPCVIGAPAPMTIPAPVAVPAPEPQLQPVEAESLAEEFLRHAVRVHRSESNS